MTTPIVAVEAAPAKLNLGLRVLGRRPDGFHELDSVFVRLDVADTIALRSLDPGQADRLERGPAGVPALDDVPLTMGPDNLVLRAAAAYRAAAARAGVAVAPLALDLTKRIPWGAGLAGGSADAAATLRALARACPAGVALEPLAELLGSDVPFCLAGVRAARVRGRGERVEPIELPDVHLVLANPGVPVAAGDAFRWWAEDPAAVVDAFRAPAEDRGTGGAPWPPAVGNALEPGVARRVPEVAAALAALRALGVGPVAMSGSGSTCFAVVPDAATATAAASELARARPAWWVSANRVV